MPRTFCLGTGQERETLRQTQGSLWGTRPLQKQLGRATRFGIACDMACYRQVCVDGFI